MCEWKQCLPLQVQSVPPVLVQMPSSRRTSAQQTTLDCQSEWALHLFEIAFLNYCTEIAITYTDMHTLTGVDVPGWGES